LRTSTKLFVALFIVTGAVTVFLSCYALFIKSQAAFLLTDLTVLNVGSSTESDVEQLTARHGRYLVSRESNNGDTTTTFLVRNTYLSAPRLEPAAWFRASVSVKTGRVYRISAQLFRSMDVYPTFQGSAGMVNEYLEYPKYFPQDGHYEFSTPVGKPYLNVLSDSHASPLQRKRAFGFSLRCLIKPGGGCDLPCDYLPSAWQDWERDLQDRGFSDIFKQYYPKSPRCDRGRGPTPD
jgi:hypothetical protein